MKGTYNGTSPPGKHVFKWWREDLKKRELVLVGTESTYIPSSLDIGCALKFEFTPVNVRGLAGETVSVKSKPIVAGIS